MAFTIETPQARLLVNLGIRTILSEEDVPEELSLCRLDQGLPTAAASPRPHQSALRREIPQRPTFSSLETPRTAPRQGSARPVQAPAPAPQKVRPVRPALLPKEDWPDEWKAIFKKAKKGFIAWTYWNLGDDLSGYADAKRRQCLNDLIKALKCPNGTHTFWPVCLPEKAPDGSHTLKANPAVFWSGLKKLEARILIVMGYKAVTEAGIENIHSPLQDTLQNGYRIWVTWDFDHIFNNTKLYSDMLTYLHTKVAEFKS